MMTLPKLVERAVQPYVAIRERVEIPFGSVIDRVMPEVSAWLASKGVQHFGPAIFKYNLVQMPVLDMEFGFVPEEKLVGDGRVADGLLPAGTYATTTYFGHYDNLVDVTGVLIAWARYHGIQWDSVPGPDGEVFASRFELYPNGPMDEPDPAKWETQIFIKVRS